MKLSARIDVAWKVLKSKSKRVRRITVMLVVVVIGTTLLLIVGSKIVINFSSSIPSGVYWRMAEPSGRSAIVVACLPTEIAEFGRQRGYLRAGACPGRTEPVGKRVVATGGDRVAAGLDGVTIDRRHLPGSEPHATDSLGRPMKWVERDELPLQPAELWLMGDDRRSWDSRYFGPVREELVIAVVTPLWTWE